MIILDTNVLSALMLRQHPTNVAAWLDQQPWTSVWTTAVTIFEIRYGLAGMPSGRRRIERELAFKRALEERLEGRILPFDEAAAEEAAILKATRRRPGRVGEMRDTIIAGIALAQHATLATRNVRHFDDLALPVIDPWQA